MSIWSQSHLWRLKWLCITASHTSLQRGMSKLYLETNRNTTTTQIICKLCSWSWCQKLNISSCKKEQFTGSSKLGLSNHVLVNALPSMFCMENLETVLSCSLFSKFMNQKCHFGSLFVTFLKIWTYIQHSPVTVHHKL